MTRFLLTTDCQFGHEFAAFDTERADPRRGANLHR